MKETSEKVIFAHKLAQECFRQSKTGREIAAALGCSCWTVRKWRRRYQEAGRSGLVSRMGRPASGALGSFLETIHQAIKTMRETHPG
jgi:transposase-like protein